MSNYTYFQPSHIDQMNELTREDLRGSPVWMVSDHHFMVALDELCWETRLTRLCAAQLLQHYANLHDLRFDVLDKRPSYYAVIFKDDDFDEEEAAVEIPKEMN